MHMVIYGCKKAHKLSQSYYLVIFYYLLFALVPNRLQDRMRMNFKHYTQLAQLEIRDEILTVNKKELEKERNRLQW